MEKTKYSANIPPRHFHFSTLVLPAHRHWHNTDLETYHFNALAMFLPVLEKMIILSIKKSLIQLNDAPTLHAEVASLVAQEAIHGREFQIYNARIIMPFYPLQIEQFSLRVFRYFAGFMNRFSRTFHFALSAAGEHFTAISAALFLKEPQWFSGVPPTLAAIWRWHCIEELEHKTVAFDVFQHLNGRYWFRIFGMLIMTLIFTTLYFKPIWMMIKIDNKHKDFRFYCRAFQYYWGKGGFCRSLLKPYFKYYHPRFHPAQQDTFYLIAQWKTVLDRLTPEQAVDMLQQDFPS